jgi:hypothetical protein
VHKRSTSSWERPGGASNQLLYDKSGFFRSK